MFLIRLSLKNLLRHKRRTIITAAIIAWAIFFYITFDSFLLGMNDMVFQNIIDFEYGHIQVADTSYWEDKDELPLENMIVNDKETNDKLIKIEGYEAHAPQLNFQVRLNDGVNETPVMGKGISPSETLKVLDYEDYIVEGEMFQAGEYKTVIGKKLAEVMKLNLGETVTLLTRTESDTFNTIDAEIGGIINTPNPNINQNVVLLPLGVVQDTLNVENKVTHYIIRLDNQNFKPGIVSDFGSELKESNSNLNVYSWRNLDEVSITKSKQAGNTFILLIVLTIAAIGIINIVILAALERMEEIGMMKAMGLTEREIVFTFVAESTGIGIIGGILGCILGAISVFFFSRYGLDFSAFVDIDMSTFGVPIISKIYGVWNPVTFIYMFFFAVFGSMFASILPARWAAKKDPVQAIYKR
ncbi:MAG: FtsX-like permease family protein [Halanaerobiales bacterium]